MNNLKQYLKINKIDRSDFALRIGKTLNSLNVALNSKITNIDKIVDIMRETGLSAMQINDQELLYNTIIIDEAELSKKSVAALEINLIINKKRESLSITTFDSKIYLTVLYAQALMRSNYNREESLKFQNSVMNDILYQFKMNAISYEKSFLSFPECVLRGK